MEAHKELLDAGILGRIEHLGDVPKEEIPPDDELGGSDSIDGG